MSESPSKIPRIKIVRRFETVDERDLESRLRFIFAPWVEAIYNNESDESTEIKGGGNENSRSTNQSLDKQTA